MSERVDNRKYPLGQRNVVWFFIFAFIVMIGAELLALPIVGLLKLIGIEFNEFTNMVFNQLAISFGAIIAVVYGIVRWREKGNLESLGLPKKDALKEYGLGFLIGLGMLGLAALLIVLFGGMSISFTGEGVGVSFIPTILIILIGWTIQGSAEEVLVRGWMLPRLSKRYGAIIGIVVSSVFFTVLHLGNNAVSFMPILNLTLFAVFASLYTIYRGNIWGIAGFHVAWNWMQGNLIGVEVSGSTVPGGTLMKLTAMGSELISGGSFGIEGSILASIVFVGASVYLVMRVKKCDSINRYINQ